MVDLAMGVRAIGARAAALALLLAMPHPGAAQPPVPDRFDLWLERDAFYLLTREERNAFRKLRDREERARFVEAFWKRRDPTPETPANELYDEHMRRLAEADRKFASGVAGWRTDRGRVYVTWGPPDFVETNPAGVPGFALGPWSLAPERPSEIWTYEDMRGRRAGTGRAQIVFVDRGGGDYRLLADPNDANLAYVYRLNTAANPLQYESAAYADPATGGRATDRRAEADRAMTLGPDGSLSSAANVFDRIAVAADLARAPVDVLADIARSEGVRALEEDVSAKLFTSRLPLSLEVPVFLAPSGQAYCPIAVHIEGGAIRFEQRDRFTATLLARGEVKEAASGRVVRQFAERLQFRLTGATHARGLAHGFSYHRGVTLPPGRYVVDIVLADEGADAIGYASAPLEVRRAERTVELGGLLLAERVAAAAPDAAAVPFTLGALEVVPSVSRRFDAGATLHAVYQVSGFAVAGSASALTADYSILQEDRLLVRSGLERLVPRDGDPRVQALGDEENATLLVAHPIGLKELGPGRYTLQVKVIDHVAGRHAIARADFTIRE